MRYQYQRMSAMTHAGRAHSTESALLRQASFVLTELRAVKKKMYILLTVFIARVNCISSRQVYDAWAQPLIWPFWNKSGW